MVRLPLTPAELERGRRLGVLLRDARGGRSMLDVAVSAGLSPETLRKIESGRIATPSFATIAGLAAELGLSLDAVWASVCDGTVASGQAEPASIAASSRATVSSSVSAVSTNRVA
jgi:transcriptional regulator with XRE-family HTH domain